MLAAMHPLPNNIEGRGPRYRLGSRLMAVESEDAINIANKFLPVTRGIGEIGVHS